MSFMTSSCAYIEACFAHIRYMIVAADDFNKNDKSDLNKTNAKLAELVQFHVKIIG